MNLAKLTVSLVLFCLSVLTLSASVQEDGLRDSLDVSSIAAFDPEWLSVYYDGYYSDCPVAVQEQEKGSPDFCLGGGRPTTRNLKPGNLPIRFPSAPICCAGLH